MNQKELRITMLGSFELAWRDGRPQTFFTGDVPDKPKALLGYLLLNRGLHQRDLLAESFWPDSEERLAKASLRVALNKLRQVGLEPYLETTRIHVGFVPQADYWFDVQAFETLVANGLRQSPPDFEALKKAIAIYQGEFLAGFSLPDITSFDEAILALRRRLEDRVWKALDMVIQSTIIETADFETGIQYARRAVSLLPWQEPAHQYLMWLLANTGQNSAAVMQYERCREALSRLEMEPSAETKTLLEEIRNYKLSANAEKVPLPPLGTALEGNAPPFLAPLQRPFFVGRHEPVAQLEQALLDNARLPRFGIVGMGGIGKTTLALQLAHTLRDHFSDGVLWANVADAQPEEIATRWAAAYDYDLTQLNSGTERLAVLRQILAQKQALLILDDVWTGAKIRHLLPSEGNCAVLITSRAERIVRSVGAEPVPLTQFSSQNGRRLLIHYLKDERAVAEPEALDEIGQLVGNLPLAITIAGSYLAYRPYRSLADFVVMLKQRIELLDLVEDAARIRETFELSWSHLEMPQTRLFPLLGLFAGRSFSLEAIAAIAEIALDTHEARYLFEDQLQVLVQLSLLQDEGDQRYRQHALLADFADAKLQERTTAQNRYVAYFANFAQQQAANYAELGLEWSNLDAAVGLAEATQQWTAVLQFTAVLKEAWFARGRFRQARIAFEIAFHAAVRLEDDLQLAHNWLWWGRACLEQGDQEEARNWLQQALDLYDELENGIGIADAQFELARLDIQQALTVEAERRLNQVLTLRQEQVDEKGTAATYSRFARLRHRQGDDEAAKDFARQAAQMQQTADDPSGRCKTLRLLVFIMIGLNQFELARQYAEESLELAKQLDDLGEIAMAYYGLAGAYRRLDLLEEADAAANESYASLVKMGDRQSMVAVRFLQCLIKRSEDKFNEAMLLAEECLAEFTRLKDALHMAYCLTHLGDFHKSFGELETAVQKWQSALAIAQKLDNHDLVAKINGRLNPIP